MTLRDITSQTLAYFFVSRIFQVHFLWETKLVKLYSLFSPSSFLARVGKKWFFQQSRFTRVNFSSQESHNSDSPRGDKELKISCKCGLSGNSPRDQLWRRNPVISACASRGQDIPAGGNKVPQLEVFLWSISITGPVLQTSPYAPTPPDEVLPPEEVAQSPEPKHLAGAVLGALDLEDLVPEDPPTACRSPLEKVLQRKFREWQI